MMKNDDKTIQLVHSLFVFMMWVCHFYEKSKITKIPKYLKSNL